MTNLATHYECPHGEHAMRRWVWMCFISSIRRFLYGDARRHNYFH